MIAIQTHNLSKAYQLGKIGTGTISRDLERFFVTKILGKEDPFLKIGQTNDRTVKGSSPIVWSLKDISFDIEQGEAVGIIGRNGAGKSTLLKLLSRVTSPTQGSIKINGRVASLLEVGTGFHPELSGRENIFLNGSILGMRKKEIANKFDEIVAFSGVERYIDTPVKRYSSGMYVRLAFAVAAHLESEILVVDEVLAVGDAEFQKKCLGKMGDISRGSGRTILFVSHNMSAVSTLCTKGILLEMGMLKEMGPAAEVVNHYFSGGDQDLTITRIEEDEQALTGKDIRLLRVEVISNSNYAIDEEVRIQFDYEVLKDMENFNLSLSLKDNLNLPILNSISPVLPTPKGRYRSTLVVPANLLNDIAYSVRIFLVNNQKAILEVDDVVQWRAVEVSQRNMNWYGKFHGVIRPNLPWEMNREIFES